MVFWLDILIGGVFIWLAIKIGFYEIWALLFNIVISIYVAIFLTPVLLDIVPGSSDIPCCHAFSLAVLGGGTFLILYGITYVFLTGQFKVAFPKLFEILFTGILGFLAGFLVLSFAALVITMTPISQNRFVKQIGFNRESQQVNISYMCLWCDMVNSIVSSDTKITSKEAVEYLLSSAQPQTESTTAGQTTDDEPVKPDDSNEEIQSVPP
jgi:hypothetical protein